MSSWILSYLEDTILLQSFLISGSYNVSDPSSEMSLCLGVCGTDVPFVAKDFLNINTLNSEQLWVSAFTTVLFYKETPLMKSERCINLQIDIY